MKTVLFLFAVCLVLRPLALCAQDDGDVGIESAAGVHQSSDGSQVAGDKSTFTHDDGTVRDVERKSITNSDGSTLEYQIVSERDASGKIIGEAYVEVYDAQGNLVERFRIEQYDDNGEPIDTYQSGQVSPPEEPAAAPAIQPQAKTHYKKIKGRISIEESQSLDKKKVEQERGGPLMVMTRSGSSQKRFDFDCELVLDERGTVPGQTTWMVYHRPKGVMTYSIKSGLKETLPSTEMRETIEGSGELPLEGTEIGLCINFDEKWYYFNVVDDTGPSGSKFHETIKSDGPPYSEDRGIKHEVSFYYHNYFNPEDKKFSGSCTWNI